MNLGLKNKIVLVTASSNGIGYATAKGFLKEGAIVILNGRNRKRLEIAMAELREYKNYIDYFIGDISKELVMKDLAQYIETKYRKLDILVLNLGRGKSTIENKLDLQEWDYLLDINLKSAVLAVGYLTELLLRGQNSNIVFLSSIVALEQSNAPYAYSAAKAGLLAFAKNLSFAYADEGIRVNTVLPGNIFFPGGRWEEILTQDKEYTMKLIGESVPLKRFGKPEEIANAIVFLASEKSAFTTGSTLVIDGGQKRGI